MKIISLSGIIGIEATPQDVRAELQAANGEPVRIDIGSPGGFVMPGLEIFNLIREYTGKTEVRLMGMAASMASYIALAADKISAHDNAVYMIHNVIGISIGDHRELRATANNFEKLTNLLAREYSKKTKKPMDEVRSMMDDETYLFGEEIADAGFADEIISTDEHADKEEACAYAQLSVQNCIKAMKESEEAESDMVRAAAYIDFENDVENFDPMAPYQNEHACRLHNPDNYVRFRRKNNAGKVDGKRIDLIIGFKKDGSSEAQAVRYPKNIWKAEDALKDCKNRKGISFEESAIDDDGCCSLIIKNIKQDQKEAKDMNLQEFLDSNPDAKALYDAKMAEAEAKGKEEGSKDALARIEKCTAFMTKEYPTAIQTLAVKALKGEEEVAALVGAVTIFDAQKEASASAAAAGETSASGETAAEGPTAVTENGAVNSEEDFQAEINRAKGGVK